MSFIQMPDGSQLAQDAIPGNITRFEHDTHQYPVMDDRKLVPITFDEMLDWIYVAPSVASADLSRQHTLYHFPRAGENHLIKSSIRGYGFIQDFNFHSYGNWDGTEDGARKAIAFLLLEAGRFPAAFEPMVSAVANIKTLVHRYTFNGGPQHTDEMPTSPHSLYMCRRAFLKVTDMNPKPPSVLTIADDPERRAATIANKWRVVDRIAFGIRQEGGTVLPASRLNFCKGDFISVTFTFDIASFTGRDKIPRTAVHLCPEQIVRLCGASDVNNVFAVQPLVPLVPSQSVQLLDSAMIAPQTGGYIEAADEFSTEGGYIEDIGEGAHVEVAVQAGEDAVQGAEHEGENIVGPHVAIVNGEAEGFPNADTDMQTLESLD